MDESARQMIESRENEPVDYKAASEKIRAFARKLIEDETKDGAGLPNNAAPEFERDGIYKAALQLAWCDAVREVWEGWAKHPEVAPLMPIAKELIEKSGYPHERFHDPICMPPGMKAFIVKVDDEEAVCLDYSMGYATPLSAIYANKIRETIDLAGEYAKKIEAGKKSAQEESK